MRHQALVHGVLCSILLSLLFLGLRQLESDLANKLHELGVLSLQFDDLRESWLTFGLLGDPAIYGVLFDPMILSRLDDGDTVVFNAVDNLLLHVLSNAMLFHMLVC